MRAILLLLVTFSTGALISQDKKVEETGKSPVVTKGLIWRKDSHGALL
jgi:hypothetical protein